MQDLKPCPFCGSTNVSFDEILDWDDELGAVVPVDGQIICKDCLIAFKQQECACEEDLIREWNRRTPVPEYEDQSSVWQSGFHCGVEQTEDALKYWKDCVQSHEDKKWIPFKMRKPDPDELEEHPDWTYVLDGQIPDDGQRILVNCAYKGHEAVQLDEFYTDAEGCYLDSGYEIGTEVTAWMPLPEPYKE